MLDAIKTMLGSKKALTALAATISALALRVGLEIPVDDILAYLLPAVAYILGQGIADHGNPKAAIVAAQSPPPGRTKTMSATERCEAVLVQNLEVELGGNDDPEVKSSIIPLILPFLMDLIAKLMERCNATPERAAKIVSKHGRWVKVEVRRGVRADAALAEYEKGCCGAIEKTAKELPEADLVGAFKEFRDVVPWSPLG